MTEAIQKQTYEALLLYRAPLCFGCRSLRSHVSYWIAAPQEAKRNPETIITNEA